VAEFKAIGQGTARGRARGHPGRGVQPHRRGGEGGPSLCYPRLDNTAYYRLDPGHPDQYYDTTGTGNSLNAGNPVALRLIMDSLRYWLTEMHVDGFRFDLATTLARPGRRVQPPVRVLRPGGAGPGGVAGQAHRRAVGRRPDGQLRRRRVPRAVARVERQVPGQHARLLAQPEDRPGEFATRFAGSSDLYGDDRRRPTASVNLITVPTASRCGTCVLRRQAQRGQREDNRDGANDTGRGTPAPRGRPTTRTCWRCGRSGPAPLLCTLLLSFGVPMLLGGDETGRTQSGNNNAYCQDNETSWVDWSAVDTGLLEFVRGLVAFRRAHPVFRRHMYLTGVEAAELGWFTPAGTPMTQADWAGRQCARARRLSRRLGRARHGPRRAPTARRRLPGPGERLVGAAGVHHRRLQARAGLAGGDRQPSTRRSPGRHPYSGSVTGSTVGPRSVWVLRCPRVSPAPESA